MPFTTGLWPLLLCPPVIQDPTSPGLAPGEVLEGRITNGDPILVSPGLRAYVDAPVVGQSLRLEVPEPGPWSIELRAYAFDAYLVLRDERGEVLAEDDDGLFGTHSRIAAELGSATRYRLDVCALHGQRGAYEVRLVAGVPPQLSLAERRGAVLADARQRLTILESRPDDLDKAAELQALATVFPPDDFPTAVELVEHALAILEQLLGPGHPDSIRGLSSLYRLRAQQGDFVAARSVCERILELSRKTFGPTHRETLLAMNDLAAALYELGDYAGMKRALLEAPDFERVLPADDLYFARSYNLLGLAHHYSGDPEKARPFYERALAMREKVLGPEHVDTALSLNNLGWFYFEQGDWTAAQPLYERAIAIYEKLYRCEVRFGALALNNLGNVRLFLGDFEGARPLLERSLAIRERLFGPDHPDVAMSLVALGRLHEMRGELDSARGLYERALSIREQTLGRDHPATAEVLFGLSMMLLWRGHYEEARSSLERARVAQEGMCGSDQQSLASTLNALANVLSAQGLCEGALPLFEHALALREKALGPEHPVTALTVGNLGQLRFQMGDLAAARDLCERALAVHERVLGPEHGYTLDSLVNLAAVLQGLGEYDSSRPLLERALEHGARALGQENPRIALALYMMGRQLYREGDIGGARKSYGQALSIQERALGPGHPFTATSLEALAVIDCDLGDLSGAKARLSTAFHRLDEHISRNFLGLTESERFTLLDRQRALLMRMLSLSWDDGEDAAAVLAWKSRCLRTLIAGREIEQGVPEEARSTRNRLMAVRARIADLAYSPDIRDRDALASRVAGLEEEATSLELDLARAWRAAGFEARGVTCEELCLSLPPGSALIDFVVGPPWKPAVLEGDRVKEEGRWLEPRITAFVHRPGRVRPARVDLGPAGEIEREAHRFLEAVCAPIRAARGIEIEATSRTGATSDPGHRLWELLWNPLTAHLEGLSSILISADGVLGNVPFGALVDEHGRFLVEALRLAVLPDPNQIVLLAEEPSSSQGLLVAGAIDYGAREDPSSEKTLDPQSIRGAIAGRAWGDLPGTRRELDEISRTWNGARSELTRLDGPSATEAALVEHLPHQRWIHLATHGYFLPADIVSMEEEAQGREEREGSGEAAFPSRRSLPGLPPGLLSGLVCAGANHSGARRDNGLLTAAEIALLDLSGTELAFLSACETAIGTHRGGEGMLSVQRAFHAAGARTVVASLWNVGDASTAELVGLFYANLWKRGLTKLDALREAQLALLAEARASGDATGAPARWAGFVLSGDWR